MSDFLNNLGKIGMVLQAGGGSLAGRDGMAVVRDWEKQQQEEQKRKVVADILAGSGIAGPQRALLEQMPTADAIPTALQMMAQMEAQRRAGGAAAAAEARRAAEQAQLMEAYGQYFGGGQPAPSAGGFSLGERVTDVMPPSQPLSFGQPSAMPTAMPAPPPSSAMPMSFGQVVTQPAAAPSPYEGARATYERLLRMPPPPPGTPQRTAYEDALKHYERLIKFSDPPDMTATEEKISLLSELGMNRNAAIEALVLNDVQRDPLTGELFIINKATGQRVGSIPEVSSATAAEPVSAPPPSGLSFGEAFSDSPNAFGVEGALRGLANMAGDVIPGVGTPFPETQQTQADFNILRENLLNDIASGYQRQPPSWLLQEIRNLTPQAGRPFEGPDAAQSKLRSIGRMLEGELRGTQEALRRRQSPQTRADLEARAASLQSSIGRIQTVLGSFGGAQLRPEVEDRLKAYE